MLVVICNCCLCFCVVTWLLIDLVSSNSQAISWKDWVCFRTSQVIGWKDRLQNGPVWGRGTPLPPCPSFPPFYFSLSFIGFIYFLLLSTPSLSTRIVPLRFQAGGRRRRPNLGLGCFFVFYLCYLYSLVKIHCGVLFYLI